MSAAALVGGGVIWYLARWQVLQRRGGRWSSKRAAAAVCGAVCIIIALAPPVASHDDNFAVHVIQRLLLGMLGPLLVALGAPLSLLLRTSGPAARHTLVSLLRARPIEVLTHPAVAVALVAGGLWATYLTPLYALSLRHALVHQAVHFHAMLGGIVLAVVFVGVDPIPRTRVGVRAAALVSGLTLHAILAKLLYAQGLPGAAVSTADRQFGAQLLWYGGDLIDLCLVTAFFRRWYVRTGRTSRPTSVPESSTR